MDFRAAGWFTSRRHDQDWRTNLNADQLDGLDSSAFYPAGSVIRVNETCTPDSSGSYVDQLSIGQYPAQTGTFFVS